MIFEEAEDGQMPCCHDIVPSQHLSWFATDNNNPLEEVSAIIADIVHETLRETMPIRLADASIGTIRLVVHNTTTGCECVYWTRPLVRPDIIHHYVVYVV